MGWLTEAGETKAKKAADMESAAQTEAENAAGWTPERKAEDSQAYNEWQQSVKQQYGGFAEMQQRQKDLADTQDPNAPPLARALSILPFSKITGLGSSGDYNQEPDIEELYKKQ